LRNVLSSFLSATHFAAPKNTTDGEASALRLYWEPYCKDIGINPVRSDMDAHSGKDVDGYAIECAYIAGLLPWTMMRMQPAKGSRLPPKPTSGLKVCGHVRRVHLKRYHFPFFVPLTQAVQACDGLCKRYIELNGADAFLPHRKEPLDNDTIARLFGLFHKEGVKVGRRTISMLEAPWASVCAMFHTMAQTGFRKAEVTTAAAQEWNQSMLSFDSIHWLIGGKIYDEITMEQFANLTEDDYCLLRPPPSKADPLGLHWGASTIYLRFHPTATINAARQLAFLECLRKVPLAQRKSTPLFCSFTGSSWGQSAISSLFREMLLLVLDDPTTASRYSMHSWRIYLACALLAAGASNGTIQTMLRWRSDEALKIYARINDSKYADWLAMASQAKVSSIRTTTIKENMAARGLVDGQQHAAFYDTWLLSASKAKVSAADALRAPVHASMDMMTQIHHSQKDLMHLAAAEEDA